MPAASSSRVLALRDARARMNAVRDGIVSQACGRSAAALLAPPSDGGWSGVEILDHIHRAERLLVRGLERAARGEAAHVPRRAYLYRLPMAPVFWPSLRIGAPKLVRPRPVADLVPAVVLGELDASRRDLLAFADGLGEERFARFLFPHFLLGRFDGVDWFRFIAGHEGKHARQLERTLAAPVPAVAHAVRTT